MAGDRPATPALTADAVGFRPGRRDLAWMAVVSVACAAVFLVSPVDQVGDSHFTLMLAEQLLSGRGFDLAPRFAKGLDENLVAADGLPYQTERVGEHVYYSFSPGSAVLSIPFVPVLRALGVRFERADGGYDVRAETRGQKILAAVLTGACAGVLFAMARTVLTRPTALIVTFGAALATPLWSTASRALWSHTWAVLFGSVGGLLLLRAQTRVGRLHPILLASVFAAAYMARPTFAVQVAAVGAWVLWTQQRRFVPFAVTTSLWVGVIAAYSRSLFGSWVPPYFAPRYLDVVYAPDALPGLLLSPSRGLVPCIPIVIFVAYAAIRYAPRPELRSLRTLAAVVIVAHTLLLSTNPLWWSGHAYGPRYMTDVVPWVVLLAVLALDGHSRAEPTGDRRWSALERVTAGTLLALSMAIHARGALAVETQAWNSSPRSIDDQPERLWDWRRPQVLAGWVYFVDGEPPLEPGQVVDLRDVASEPFLGRGWSLAERHQRWAMGPAAEIGFSLRARRDLLLRLEAEPFLAPGLAGRQRVLFSLNGRPIGRWSLHYSGVRTYTVRLPADAQSERNRLRLLLPDATSPGVLGSTEDRRRLALAVHTMRIEALPEIVRGRPVAFAADGGAEYRGEGWSEPEASHRWTEGPEADLWFATHDTAPAVLRLVLTPFLVPGQLDRQRFSVDLNGWTAAQATLSLGGKQLFTVLVPPGALARDNVLRLRMPDAPAAAQLGSSPDPRPLGVAIESITLDDPPLYPAQGGIDPQDLASDAFLVDGWSWEDGSRPSPRWAVAPRARLVFALGQTTAKVLRVDVEPFTAPGLERQRVELALNGVRLPTLDLRGPARDEYAVALPPGILASAYNVLSLDLPDARSAAALGLGADSRPLGVIVRGVHLE